MAKRRRTGPLKPASPKVPRRGERYPFVALVGRPNTGKSTLFNRLVGKRLAITEPTAGTTRDRLAAMVELEDGRMIELCDMGGVGGTGDAFDKDVNRQVDLAMDYADLILLLVDARAGLVPLDEQIARRLKKLKKPVLMVANKVETQAIEHTTGEFYALGLEGDVIPVSAIEGTGKGDLLEAISQALPVVEQGEPLEDEGERLIRIAIVGKRNVGKSTYVNHLFGSERVIASDTAGTTRDAIDVRVTVAAKDVVLIDTAGVRKRGRVDDHIEVISHGRAQIAIQRCDVALLFIDCLENVTQLDKKLAGVIAAEHKACVVVANKWDLVEDRMDLEKYADYIHHELPGLRHAPLAAISAKDGLQATAPISLAFDLFAQSCTRIGTGPLNRALGAALTLRRPKPLKNKIGKIYFGTQIATNPVTLLIFVNDPMLFKQSYRRYLVGQLRKSLPWGEIPIKLVFRARESLYKRGGGLARRVKKLPGLAEEARWIDDAPTANAQEMGESLDAEDVQAVLLDAFGNDEPADHPDDDEDET